jgi:hypothetical protein
MEFRTSLCEQIVTAQLIVVEIRLWRYANKSLAWFGAAGYRTPEVQLEPNCYAEIE